MITLDDRTGSKELMRVIPKGRAEIRRLQYGDASFIGNGPDDAPVFIGVERKAILDMLQSMTSGRFSGHQLPGLLSCYGVVYLVLEGVFRADPRSGLLTAPRGRSGWQPIAFGQRRFMAKELWNFCNTLQVVTGVHIVRTGTMRETGQWLVAAESWWSKDYHKHKGHRGFDNPQPPAALLRKPGLVRRIAKELPGVGWTRSGAVENAFPSVVDMAMAEECEWAAIPGIGPVLASRIYQAVAGTNGQEKEELL